MQATARRLSVVSATSCARRRLIRDGPEADSIERIPDAMTTTQKLFCRLVGSLGIACSAIALYYNTAASFSVLSRPLRPDTPVYFREFFVLLTLIAAVVAIGVAFGSFELIRLRRRGGVVTTVFASLPVGLIFVVGGSWLIPSFGSSIAAATGVSLGGLMPMLVTLLPLWAGLLILFVFRSPAGPTSPQP